MAEGGKSTTCVPDRVTNACIPVLGSSYSTYGERLFLSRKRARRWPKVPPAMTLVVPPVCSGASVQGSSTPRSAWLTVFGSGRLHWPMIAAAIIAAERPSVVCAGDTSARGGSWPWMMFRTLLSHSREEATGVHFAALLQ